MNNRSATDRGIALVRRHLYSVIIGGFAIAAMPLLISFMDTTGHIQRRLESALEPYSRIQCIGLTAVVIAIHLLCVVRRIKPRVATTLERASEMRSQDPNNPYVP